MCNKMITVLMIVLATALFSADRFAVIIAGNYNPTNVPADQLWNNGQGDYSEFWNDLYLQWEMLYQKGYAKENITVIFANGTDMWRVPGFEYIDRRYRAFNATRVELETITNYSATKQHVADAVAALNAKIQPDDFLYVWAMSHGGTSTQSGLYFNDGLMTDTEFAGLFNTITANKKHIVISANYAQGFQDKFTGANVRVEISSQATKSNRADDKAVEGGAVIPFLENELINGYIYYHGEFNFHKYAASLMQTQYGSTSYNGIDLQTVDTHNDDQVTFSESYAWTSVKQSDTAVTSFFDSGEVTPYYTFPMGDYSSLDYPTLVYNSFGSAMEYFAYQYPTKKGIVGIAEDLNIANEYFDVSLGLSPNSLTTILDDHSINVNNGAYKAAISMGSGSILKGTNNNVINLNGSYFSLDRALVKDVTIGNNYGGSIFVENSSEFNNVSTTLFGSSIDFDYPTGIKEITELEEFTLSNYSDLFIEYGTIQGSYLYPDPNIVNIIDGSVLTVGIEATFNRINLNIEDWGIFNYSNNCIFNESEINVSNSGRLNFPAGGVYTPATIINAGLNGQIVIADNSTLNLNTGILNMVAGSSMTLSKGASLKPVTGYTFTYPRSTSLNLGDESNLYGAIDFFPGSSCKTGWQSTVNLKSGAVVEMTETNLVLNYGCDLIVEAGAKLSLVGPMRVIMCPGSEIIVHGEFSATPDVIYTTNVDEADPDKVDEDPWGGIVANVGSIINISGATFENAALPISGTPASINITNCTFTDCQNGINLVNCSNFSIENNTFTGSNSGVAVSLTGSNGQIKYNTIENYAHGVVLILSSPLMSKNIIRNNVMNGVYVTGNNAYPQLIDPLELKIVVNNEIADNGINIIDERNAQIRMIYPSNAYMYNGMNNVYFDLQAPAIRTESNMIVNDQMKSLFSPRVYINAENNYWGASAINDLNYEDIFDLWNESPLIGYSIRYSPYAEIAFTDGLQTPALYSTLSTEGIFLAQAIKAEFDGKIDLAIKKYNHIIEKYPESDENYIALTRLTDIYAAQELPLDQLMAIYEENIISGDESVNKKFYKEMKVATSIKGKKYDEAIVFAEALKVEAQTETEVLLAEIDIAIANMMKNAGSKGGAFKADSKINDLIAQISDSDVKGGNSPLSLNGQVLPAVHTLHQNFPNPFNPVTQIKFDLAKSAKVRLSVYNISGQLVSELASGVMNAGNHVVEFDGSKLNSGVYYYTLETDDLNITKKMVLTK